MAKVIFSSDLQRFTGGTKEADVVAANYRDLVAELNQRFPELTESEIKKRAIVIDSVVIQTPLLETFNKNSELVFLAKIGGG